MIRPEKRALSVRQAARRRRRHAARRRRSGIALATRTITIVGAAQLGTVGLGHHGARHAARRFEATRADRRAAPTLNVRARRGVVWHATGRHATGYRHLRAGPIRKAARDRRHPAWRIDRISAMGAVAVVLAAELLALGRVGHDAGREARYVHAASAAVRSAIAFHIVT